jgi:predicted nucleic acid-binding protein
MVAAVRSNRGASNILIRAVLHRRMPWVISVPLMFGYEATLTRPEHLAAAGLVDAEIGALLDALALVAEPVRLSFLWRPRLGDPDDEMVLETAVNGRADAIVTFNKRHFAAAGEFGIEILTPGECLGRMNP